MKKHAFLPLVLLLTWALWNVSDSAASSDTTSAVGAGLRMHSDHSVFTDLPYGDNDISYLLGWEIHEEDGYCQLAVDYAPSVSGNETTDYVVTPQLNLLFQDRLVVGGLGILQSYISDSAEGGDWTDIYWQLTVGLRFPIGSVAIAAQTYYVFDHWGDLSEFKGKDLDYGLWLTYAF